MALTNGPMLPLLLAFLIMFITIVPGGGYVAMKTWFYFLNSRFRKQSASIRESLAKEAMLSKEKNRAVFVGFFHPYCNAGGGGERVLWTAIKTIQQENPEVISVVYSGDTKVTSETILDNVQRRFNIILNHRTIHIVPLYKRHWVSASRYPYFTMLGQSLGSLILAYEAISSFVPDVFIDTMGYAFTLPFVSSVLEIPTAAYVHYPTISTDMLGRVSGVSVVKQGYWRLFALVYGYVCGQMDLLWSNSSWTGGHVQQLTGKRITKGEIRVIFPPCDTKALTALPLSPREKSIIYVAQFRPEKDHITVLKAFSILLTNHPTMRKDAKLVLIGSVRDDRDKERVASLRQEAKSLDVLENVEFVVDAPWDTIVSWLGRGWIGTNAMWNEHFGIGVVEYMAAGLIPVVHNSGGPKLDIVTPLDGNPTGFHASTPAEFAQAYAKALTLSEGECLAMRQRARESAERFSERVFMNAWTEEMQKLLTLEKRYRGERIYRTQGT